MESLIVQSNRSKLWAWVRSQDPQIRKQRRLSLFIFGLFGGATLLTVTIDQLGLKYPTFVTLPLYLLAVIAAAAGFCQFPIIYKFKLKTKVAVGALVVVVLVGPVWHQLVELIQNKSTANDKAELKPSIITGAQPPTSTSLPTNILAAPPSKPDTPKKQESPEQLQAKNEHLKKLHASLMQDSNAYKRIGEALRVDGRSLNTSGEDYVVLADMDWRADTLSSDLKNHCPEYTSKKSKLEKDIEAHNVETGRLLREISGTIKPDPNLTDLRIQEASLSYLDKCQGRGDTMQLKIDNSGGWRYSSHGGSQGSSGGPVNPDMMSGWQAYLQLQQSKPVEDKCTALRSETGVLLKRVEELDREALRLMQKMILAGECEYIH